MSIKDQDYTKGRQGQSQSYKCECPLGEYAHSSSEYCDFRYPEDIDGMGNLFPLVFYKYCRFCGKDLKDDIKKLWGNYKYKALKFRIKPTI